MLTGEDEKVGTGDKSNPRGHFLLAAQERRQLNKDLKEMRVPATRALQAERNCMCKGPRWEQRDREEGPEKSQTGRGGDFP